MAEPIEVQLRHLCHATYELGETTTVRNGPAGVQLVSEVSSARFEGDRFRASLHGRSAADWASIEPDGRVLIDARLTLLTDDGAAVLLTYTGRGDAATGISYSAPLFETDDERYLWLTRVQIVGKSSFDGTTLEYEMFELV